MKKLITMSGVLIVGVMLSSCQMEDNIRSNKIKLKTAQSKANSISSDLTVLNNNQKKLESTVANNEKNYKSVLAEITKENKKLKSSSDNATKKFTKYNQEFNKRINQSIN